MRGVFAYQSILKNKTEKSICDIKLTAFTKTLNKDLQCKTENLF